MIHVPRHCEVVCFGYSRLSSFSAQRRLLSCAGELWFGSAIVEMREAPLFAVDSCAHVKEGNRMNRMLKNAISAFHLLSTCCRLMLRRLNPKHERIIPKSKISEVFQIEVYHGKSGKRWLWPSQKLYHHQFWWCRRFHPSTLSFIMMQNREDMCRVHEVSPCTVWNPLSMTLLTATSTEQMNVAMSLFAKNSRPQAKQQCHSICYHAIISSRCNWLTWWRMQTYLAQCSAWGIRWFLGFKQMQTVCRC